MCPQDLPQSRNHFKFLSALKLYSVKVLFVIFWIYSKTFFLPISFFFSFLSGVAGRRLCPPVFFGPCSALVRLEPCPRAPEDIYSSPLSHLLVSAKDFFFVLETHHDDQGLFFLRSGIPPGNVQGTHGMPGFEPESFICKARPLSLILPLNLQMSQ